MVQPIGEPEPYDRFRVGLTFSDVCAELRREADQALELEGRRMFWSRRTVLGRWRQHKLAAYEQYRRRFAPPRPEWWDDYAPVRR